MEKRVRFRATEEQAKRVVRRAVLAAAGVEPEPEFITCLQVERWNGRPVNVFVWPDEEDGVYYITEPPDEVRRHRPWLSAYPSARALVEGTGAEVLS